MSTIEATLSTRAVVSSVNESDEVLSNKVSEQEENNNEIAYLKVKTKKIKVCLNHIENIVTTIEDKFAVKVDISLLEDGHYREYFRISSNPFCPDAIEEVKRMLLEIENKNNL